jgi:hypothetical protein
MDGASFRFFSSEKRTRSILGQGRNRSDEWCLFFEIIGKLERVSIRGAHSSNSFVRDLTLARQPIPEAALAKFVRCATRLRWLASDLTPDSVAALREIRPDVTFAS